MWIKCLFFAGAKDLTGVRELALEVDEGCTTTQLQDKVVKGTSVWTLTIQLLNRFPGLKEIWDSCVFAVNQEYVEEDTEKVLREGDEVAVIPPISGG